MWQALGAADWVVGFRCGMPWSGVGVGPTKFEMMTNWCAAREATTAPTLFSHEAARRCFVLLHSSVVTERNAGRK